MTDANDWRAKHVQPCATCGSTTGTFVRVPPNISLLICATCNPHVGMPPWLERKTVPAEQKEFDFDAR